MNQRLPWAWLCLTITLLLPSLLLVSGCKKSVAEDASISDANGFLCPNCGAKFYTSLRVFPSYCPKCKKTDILEVVGYISEDGQVVLGPRDQQIRDPKTRKPITAIKLPREKDLMAWGAAKKSAAEVGSAR